MSIRRCCYVLLLLSILVSCQQHDESQIQVVRGEDIEVAFKIDEYIYYLKISDSYKRLLEYGVTSGNDEFFSNIQYNKDGTLKSSRFSVSEAVNSNSEGQKQSGGAALDGKKIKEVFERQDVKKHIVYHDDREVYYAVYEKGKKVYNSFNLVEFNKNKTRNEAIVSFRNDFPFKGELKFSLTNFGFPISVTRNQSNEYTISVKIGGEDFKELMFDIELLPSESDTLLNSNYTQVVEF